MLLPRCVSPSRVLEDQGGIAAAEGVDRLLDVADEDDLVRQLRELDEDGELHGVGVLELVHQQELELVAEALAHLRVVEGMEHQLLHVGEVDQAALGLDRLEAFEGLAGDVEERLDVGADVGLEGGVDVVSGGCRAHGRGPVVAFLGGFFLAQADPLDPGAVGAVQDAAGAAERLDVFLRALCRVRLEVDAGQRVVHGAEQLGLGIAAGWIREMREQRIGVVGAHLHQCLRRDVVAAGGVGELFDHAEPVGHSQAAGDAVQGGDAVAVEHLVDGLVEEVGRVVEAHDVQLRRQAELEGESLQQSFAHAVHGADEGLADLLLEGVVAVVDQALAHLLLDLGRRLDGEGRGHHAARARAAGRQRLLEVLGEVVGLAAAGAGAGERDVGELAGHCEGSQPVRAV